MKNLWLCLLCPTHFECNSIGFARCWLVMLHNLALVRDKSEGAQCDDVTQCDGDTKGNCSIPISNNIGSKEHKMFINAQWCWYLTIGSIFDTFAANYILPSPNVTSIDFSLKSFVSTFTQQCFPNELPSFYKSEGKLLRKERKLLRSLVKSSITAVLSVNNLCLFISNWNYLNNNNPFRNPYNLIFDKIHFQEL